jgi:hypothetical protein
MKSDNLGRFFLVLLPHCKMDEGSLQLMKTA